MDDWASFAITVCIALLATRLLERLAPIG